MTSEARTLRDAIVWEDHLIPSTLANRTVAVRVGRVGAGHPVGVLPASVHGDEGPWGTLAINRLLEQTPLSELAGCLRIVPVANPLATELDARQSDLDLLDLNNAFPGDTNGTHTQRLAAVLAVQVLDGADVVLDVHGGGSWNINCFTYRFPGSHELAEWIGTPLIHEGPDRPTSLTGYARSRGATAVWIEMGGRGDREEDRAATVTAGLRRALGKAGVLSEAGIAPGRGLVARRQIALCTASPGIYLPIKREADLGTIVVQGTLIGQLLDPISSEILESFHAPYAKSALALLRPTMARIEGPGKVVAIVSDVTDSLEAGLS